MAKYLAFAISNRHIDRTMFLFLLSIFQEAPRNKPTVEDAELSLLLVTRPSMYFLRQRIK